MAKCGIAVPDAAALHPGYGLAQERAQWNAQHSTPRNERNRALEGATIENIE